MLSKLRRDDLATEINRQIYEAAQLLDAQDRVPDASSIAECNHDIPRDYLFQLMDVACTERALDQNIEPIRTAARRRALAQIGQQLADGARAEQDPNKLIADTECELRKLDEQSSGGIINGASAAIALYRTLDRKGKPLSTGLPPLDDILGGMVSGGLYVFAARPGVGKTALALQIAEYVVSQQNAVLFVSLEMSTAQIQARRVARYTQINSRKLLMSEELSKPEWEKISAANTLFSKLPFYMNAQESCTVQDVRALARKIKGLKLIVIDYLGLLRSDNGRARRYEQITEISNSLKALARGLDIPILCLAQLNRASEQRAEKQPILSDLRDSGAIEQDADAVVLLHRPDLGELPAQHAKEQDDRKNNALCMGVVAKNRHGKVGAFQLAMNLPTGQFLRVSGVQPSTAPPKGGNLSA